LIADDGSCEVLYGLAQSTFPPPLAVDSYKLGMRVDVQCKDGAQRSGTVRFVMRDCNSIIVVFDEDWPMILLTRQAAGVRHSSSAGPAFNRQSFLEAVLNCKMPWISCMATALKNRIIPKQYQWTLALVDKLSRSLQRDTRTNLLRFTEIVGKGAYGLVLRCDGRYVLKTGVVRGYPPFWQNPLWRDYYLHSEERLRPHVAELHSFCAQHAYVQIKYDDPCTVSLLCMEYLPYGVADILKEGKQEWKEHNHVPDASRILALEAFHALNILHTHDLIHGDIKPENVKLRYYSDGSYVLVFIDGGCSRQLDGKYKYVKCNITPEVMPGDREINRFTTAATKAPPRTCQLQVFGSMDRPATPGYRIDPAYPARSPPELKETDVHALAIIFLTIAGLEPGLLLREAELFESRIYEAVNKGDSRKLVEMVPHFKAGVEWGGIGPSCTRWMELMYQALRPVSRLTASEALCSYTLRCPNYPQQLLASLQTTGLVVYCRSLKPVAVFLHEGCRLEFFTLLNCDDMEPIVHFEPRHMPGGRKEHPSLHNGFLVGSFAQLGNNGKLFGRLGAYLEYSRLNHSIYVAGTVHLPVPSDWQQVSGENKATRPYVPMHANGKLPWGTRLTCDWSLWSDGSDATSHAAGTLKNELSLSTKSPAQLNSALELLRRQVLEDGNHDSWSSQPE
jgi:serine/threonine protein kinase